jgi:hypothetical protein
MDGLSTLAFGVGDALMQGSEGCFSMVSVMAGAIASRMASSASLVTRHNEVVAPLSASA